MGRTYSPCSPQPQSPFPIARATQPGSLCLFVGLSPRGIPRACLLLAALPALHSSPTLALERLIVFEFLLLLEFDQLDHPLAAADRAGALAQEDHVDQPEGHKSAEPPPVRETAHAEKIW